jgi:hypothetical protein
MMFRCFFGHERGVGASFNDGVIFAECEACGTPIVRRPSGRWYPLPKGYRVAWKPEGEHALSARELLAKARREAPLLHRRRTRRRDPMAAYYLE